MASAHGSIPVEHGSVCIGTRPSLAILVQIATGKRTGAAAFPQSLCGHPPILSSCQELRQPWDLKEEDIPTPTQLIEIVAQVPLHHRPMRDIQNHHFASRSGYLAATHQATAAPQSCPTKKTLLLAGCIDQTNHISC